jgi:hypothetical protein
MTTFIMLTRLSPDALRSPKSLEELEKKVMDSIRSQCPEVQWVHNFALLGPYGCLSRPGYGHGLQGRHYHENIRTCAHRDLGGHGMGRI